MARLTFYPLGNADSCRIDLVNGKKLLIDYANTRDPDNNNDDLRIDLPSKLREDLEQAKRDYYDIVAFTHLDKDHFKGASEFFYLEHAKKYQTAGRIKIRTMWVPAALITETAVEDTEGRIIQAEARHRFREGGGIRVFSRPERLKQWLEDNDLTVEERRDLITDAGQVVPGLTVKDDGVEFFVHSPFAKRLNADEVEDRNSDCIVVHATFLCGDVKTKLLLCADCVHEMMAEIVDITKAKKNDARLDWDICKIAHHCSYHALGPEKGEDQTTPVESVRSLFEDHGEDSCIMLSTSEPIPSKGSEADKDDNPPHRQAANYYKDVEDKRNGEFFVSMEHPKSSAPEPLVIDIDDSKATVQKRGLVGASAVVTHRAPRAG